MAKLESNLRLIPAVLVACSLLLGLKVVIWSSGIFATPVDTSSLKRFSNASTPDDNRGFSRVFEFVRSNFTLEDQIVTGSVGADKPKDEKPKDDYELLNDKAKIISTERPKENIVQGKASQTSETILLDRLLQRRNELDEREKAIEEKKLLLEAAQKKLEEQVETLKKNQVNLEQAKTTENSKEDTQLKSLILMYETMRAKDAAKIFDRLDMRILSELAKNMKPQKLGDILAQMQTENAEKLTRELARKSVSTPQMPTIDNLPKIQGKPMS